MKKISLRFLIAPVLVCLSAVSLFGQANTTATLRGTVMDKTQAVIPGAEVRITGTETGLARSATTNAEGSYVFNLLPAGHYNVRVTVRGFNIAAFENVELTVGQTTTIDATLAPSAQAETVTVESNGATLVDIQKTDVSRPITPAEVENMPLNGRDFVNLALLAPGARPMPSYDPTKARIGVFATNGSSGRNVNITVNGIDNKDGTVGGPVMQLPLEAIEEFNISTQRFSAANGRSEGAAVNVITKSGTNNYHGVLYFFDRDKPFNALNYFEETAHGGSGQKSDFSRQQFGGSIGGPVQKDKTFLFFALERAREQTSLNISGPTFTELSLLPASFGANPVHSLPTPYFDWRYNGRVDHRIDEKNNVSFSYANQNNRGLNDQATSTLIQNNFTTNQLIIANGSWNSVITPNIVNAVTLGYQYWHNVIQTDTPGLQNVFPAGNFGTAGAVPQESVQRKWQFKDDIAITKGKHSFKTGFDYLWEPQLGGLLASSFSGVLTFNDNPSVILGNTNGKYPQGFASAGAIQSFTYGNGGNPYFFLSGKMFGLYFQDDWKVKRNVTINLGVRWDKDFNLNGHEEQATARAFLDLQKIGSPYGSHLPNDDNKDFSPRFGLAWDVKGNSKHVVRVGYGLYYGQTFINIPLFMIQQANSAIYTTTSYTTSSIIPTTGQPLSAFRFGVDQLPTRAPGGSQLIGSATVGQNVDPNYRNPYSQQWNGGYTWAITSDSVIEAEYVHVLGLHESKTIVVNPTINGAPRATDAPFTAAGIPLFGRVSDYMSIGRSRYDGMNLSYRRRLSKRFSANATYTLSKAVAYNGNAAAFGNAPSDLRQWFSPEDFGPTPADERHRITISGLVNLPWRFEFAPIMQWATGRPWTPLEGQNDSYNFGGGAGNTHAVTLDSAPNDLTQTKTFSVAQLQACLYAGTCHQIGYNTMRGEDFFQLDARFSRDFKFGEKAHLQLIFQAFDLTNRANFGVNYQTSIRAATFGQPTNFIGGTGVIVPKSFSGEFGAKFSF
jgi:hypothetical protein